MPFILPALLSFQGSAHLFGVESLSNLISTLKLFRVIILIYRRQLIDTKRTFFRHRKNTRIEKLIQHTLIRVYCHTPYKSICGSFFMAGLQLTAAFPLEIEIDSIRTITISCLSIIVVQYSIWKSRSAFSVSFTLINTLP